MDAHRIVAIRGATTVDRDDPELVREATRELLTELVRVNELLRDHIVSVIFTMTVDLHSEFPAHAARELGWNDIPLLCAAEIDVPSGLPRCIRVLMHVQTGQERDRVRHVYLREATVLRPDIGEGQG